MGIVEETGPGVDPALKGRRVAVAGLKGSWAEYAVAQAAGAIPVPDEMPDAAAAQLIAMPFSAITLLEFLHVSRGDWGDPDRRQRRGGQDHGRAGAVARRAPAEPGPPPEAVEELTAMGMTDVISTSDPDWVAKARAIIGKDGARAAVDSVGGAVAAGLVDLLGTEGLLVTFGSTTGEGPAAACRADHLQAPVRQGLLGCQGDARHPRQRIASACSAN